MNNNDWKLCLTICSQVLGKGDWNPYLSESWCAFTTFSSLTHGIHYFSCGFPSENEFLETCTSDGGLWRQSFKYNDLAHLVVPKTFYWEISENGFQSGYKEQNISELSVILKAKGIEHRITELVLEVKLY